MKFMISRTSAWDGKPCEEAYLDTYTYIDRRSADSPDKIPAYTHVSTDWWYTDGENHRAVDDQIMRDFPGKEAWFIDIATLEELLALQKKYGNLIIESYFSNGGIFSVEIYDDYRE